MRPKHELTELPFSFWQQPLLTAKQFSGAAEERGVRVSDRDLEGLHRSRLLVPFLRVKRNGREIAAAAAKGDPAVWEMARWRPTSMHDLQTARREGRLFDPSSEHFIARHRLKRQIGDLTYSSSEYLYSPHQLLALRVTEPALSLLTLDVRGRAVGVQAEAHWLRWARGRVRALDETAIALTALEPIYLPEITGRRHFNGSELEDFEEWYERLRPSEMLTWLRIDADWLRETAFALIGSADAFDPLGPWTKLIREADPRSWEKLKGSARLAVDYRIAAEILLRYYERLASGSLAKSLPRPQRGRFHLPSDRRFRPRGGVDAILHEFGLSPHPKLILALEGATERSLMPQVMAHFGVRLDRGFIALMDAEGVDTDLSPLVAFAITPQTPQDEDRDYLNLLTHPTRLLAMMDPEGSVATSADRSARERKWVDRIMRTMPREHRTDGVRDSIERLVSVKTWDRKGQSFEFAHFTDRELARALEPFDSRPKQPSATDRINAVARVRASRGNLASVIGERSKSNLADALWPVLERKIRRATKSKTETRIPIVAALDFALDLATEFPHGSLVISLRRRVAD